MDVGLDEAKELVFIAFGEEFQVDLHVWIGRVDLLERFWIALAGEAEDVGVELTLIKQVPRAAVR